MTIRKSEKIDELMNWRLAAEMVAYNVGYFDINKKSGAIEFTILLDELKSFSIVVPFSEIPYLYKLWKLQGETGIIIWLEKQSDENNVRFERPFSSRNVKNRLKVFSRKG